MHKMILPEILEQPENADVSKYSLQWQSIKIRPPIGHSE